MLTTPIAKQSMIQPLVEDWNHLLDLCRRPAVPRTPHVPLCRDRILAAEPDIQAMLATLSERHAAPGPGIAIARRLLRDGTGPLYNRHSSVDLGALIRDITSDL